MRALLEVRKVQVRFDGLVAVQDVSLTVEGGQLVGLIGPNGAGKTTLLRVCAGLQVPTRGEALIFGKPVLNEHEIVRHHLGFAPDTPPVYEDITVDQFLGFIGAAYHLSAPETRERSDFWLEQLWLIDKRDSKIKHLSRGMRQRVTLARTFLPQPHVILLDEPLSGLDPAGRIRLRGLLTMLREQGCAMIVSSHILTDLEEVATDVAIIERGRVLRHTRTSQLHRVDSDRIRFRLQTLGAPSAHLERLQGVEGVGSVTFDQGSYVVEWATEAVTDPGRDAGDGVEAAVLLRRIMESGVPVTSFGAIRQSLEDAYLKAGVREVD